jgi:hypothetical protein
MKKLLIFTALMFTTNSFGQEISLFKGLNLGMSKKEAKAEYKANKSEYDNIDIGNGWVWKTTVQNFLLAITG